MALGAGLVFGGGSPGFFRAIAESSEEAVVLEQQQAQALASRKKK